MNLSKLHMVSLGIVSEHKKPSTKMIKVMPAEVLTELDGELRSIPVELFSAGVDSQNRKYTVQVTGDTSLPAEWLQLGTHRQTAPDVRRGERVILWKHGNENKYYWSCYGMDDNLRRLETIVWAISNISDPKANVDQLNADNAYLFEVSTHGKYINIRTNKNDGEPFAYLIQLNTKDGNFTVRDDVGNYVQLDSKESTIDLTNKLGTFLRLNKKNIFGYAKDSIFMEAVEKMEFKCTNFLLKAKDVLVDAPKTKFTGEVEVDKKVTVNDALETKAGIKAGGKVDSQGFTAPGGVWHKH